ncbi:MAG TPA: hypothetical protein VFZ65_02285 [Planctomycetota bacterium]|nr:hypothetical protein [Planctomycetota bacterium]
MSAPSRARSPALIAFYVALVMNLVNLFEPLTVDDVCHQYYAAQVAKDPLHPFEFEVPWHQRPQPAWNVMVAPVNSYYWAPAIAWFGDSPTAWHLWYLPVHWLFCYSLLTLLRRFVREHAAPLMAAIALGPSVLPGVNLMLEVPMLALGLSGLAVLLQAFDRRSLRLAAAAGLLQGLALQTKYSAMGLFGLWFLGGLLQRRPREFLVACAVAGAVALGIEGLVALSHEGGGSYFLRQLELTQYRDWSHLVRGMFMQVGGLGVPAALLALYALRAPRWVLGGAGLLYLVAFAVVAIVPNDDDRGLGDLALDSVAYLFLSLTTWGAIAALLWRVGRAPLARLWRTRRLTPAGRTRLFFCGWAIAQIAASFVVSPFPAARRAMVVVIAMTFSAGWVAARTRRHGPGVVWICALSVALGLFYEGVDHLEGRACVACARDAAAWAKATDATAKVWFTGGWSFEFYAPRAGMLPLHAGRVAVKRGDFVVVGSIDGSETSWFEPTDKLEEVYEVKHGDCVPYSLLFHYYSGLRPLDSQSGPRYFATIYRAKVDFHTSELVPHRDPWHR